MNPLGSLPATTSPPGQLNAIDWRKILRSVLVQGIGLAITLAPKLEGARYVWRGVDLTPYVLILISAGVECGRRFLTGAPTRANGLSCAKITAEQIAGATISDPNIGSH